MDQLEHNFQQALRMYSLIESHLKRAAKTDTPLSIAELNAMGDIAATSRNPWHVRDCVRSLAKNQHIVKVGEGTGTKYKRREGAEPFVPSRKSMRLKIARPSKAEVVKLDTARTERATRAAAPAAQNKEVELVIGQALIVLGQNPATGRLRIVIEDAGSSVQAMQQ